jgi:hypothetical protein
MYPLYEATWAAECRAVAEKPGSADERDSPELRTLDNTMPEEDTMRSHQTMTRFALTAAIAGLLVAIATNPSHGEVIANEKIPFDPFVAFVDCDGDGEPEDIILLTGDLHVKITETVDAAGGVHTTALFHPQGFVGVGLLTGDTYQGVGMTGFTTNDIGDPFIDKLVNNFHMVARGGGINFNVKSRITVVIIDGEIIVDINVEEITCH